MFISDLGLDTRKPLQCSVHFPDQHPQELGVLVSAPFFHHGLKGEYVDISRETVRVNTQSFGDTVPAEQAERRAITATGAVVDELTAVIRELTEHRDRLIREMEN